MYRSRLTRAADCCTVSRRCSRRSVIPKKHCIAIINSEGHKCMYKTFTQIYHQRLLYASNSREMVVCTTTFTTCDAIDKSVPMTITRSWTMIDVATYCPQMSTHGIDIGICKLDKWMTVASNLPSLRTNPFSQSHIFTEASIQARASVCVAGGKSAYNYMSSVYR